MTVKQRAASNSVGSRSQPLSRWRIHTWTGFLPARAIVMGRLKRGVQPDPVTVPSELLPAPGPTPVIVFLFSQGNARTVALLDRMIQAMGLTHEQVLCVEDPSTVPANSTMFVTFGQEAFEALSKKMGIDFNYQRGKLYEAGQSRRILPTHALDHLLKVAEAKKDTWSDLQEVLRALGLPLPKKGGR